MKLNLLEVLVRYLDDYTVKNSQEHQLEEASIDNGKDKLNNDGEFADVKGDDVSTRSHSKMKNFNFFKIDEIMLPSSGQSDRSSCVSNQSGEHDALLSHTDTDTVASVG